MMEREGFLCIAWEDKRLEVNMIKGSRLRLPLASSPYIYGSIAGGPATCNGYKNGF